MSQEARIRQWIETWRETGPCPFEVPQREGPGLAERQRWFERLHRKP